ncbi:NEW3 domain-containing protein [Micromonospora sp. SL1-18]|uniref:NEW3 domain-containing protein n=1 Tax=Micromonospora sp. SL1-18 TaxID=3399128 RepID=UPI003A4DAEE6
MMVATMMLTSAASTNSPYTCAPTTRDTIEGANGDASVIGWEANRQGVVACLGGSFYVQNGVNTTYGYGIYNNSPTKWYNAEGYLPALVTSFKADGADVSITNFGDKVVIDGNAYVAIYSRVKVHNPTKKPVDVSPAPSAGLLPLNDALETVAPGATVNHDYVVVADRFGGTYAWPSDTALQGAGGFDKHYAHMRSYWNGRLAQVAQIADLPNRDLVDAYKSGFIYTHIIRRGDQLNTGANGGYSKEYSHDAIGILVNLFTQGDFSNARALLERANTVVGTQPRFPDAKWTYAWPWAIYLQKTGDLAFVKEHFDKAGPLGDSQEPSIKTTAHMIAADRTGPGGIMKMTADIDSDGYWAIDNYTALTGLAAYRYLAERVGDSAEAVWARDEYDSLLAAVNKSLETTISTYNLDYLPCSMVQPNTYNDCRRAEDANWAAPFLFGRWAWDGYLFGAPISGPGSTMIDATYDHGFFRLQGKVPAGTFGGYGGRTYSSAYNAGYGEWGLASGNHRDQGILSYEFMIDNAQSGPYSWWENQEAPGTTSPWVGVHPEGGWGSAPHAWGMANANKVLLDSLVAQRADGKLIVGRGIPGKWLTGGKPFAVTNFPTTDGRRVDVTIKTRHKAVTLLLSGDKPSSDVLFQLPAFVNNIAGASVGTIDQATGTVTLSPDTKMVTVDLRRAPLAATRLTLNPATSIVATPGQKTTVSSTLTNSGPGAVSDVRLALTVPSGWQVTPAGRNSTGRLAAGSSFTARWTVTAPSTASGTQVANLAATARYTDTSTGEPVDVANKSVPTPVITSVSPATASEGDVVTVRGANFGASKGSSYLAFDNAGTTWGQFNSNATFTLNSWSDDAITFTIPSPSGSGGEWHVVPGTTATARLTTIYGETPTSTLTIGD